MAYGFLILLGVMATILVLAALVEDRDSLCPRGGKHSFYSPAFRLRVCCKCQRREFLLRRWEFDGYEKPDARDCSYVEAAVAYDRGERC